MRRGIRNDVVVKAQNRSMKGKLGLPSGQRPTVHEAIEVSGHGVRSDAQSDR